MGKPSNRKKEYERQEERKRRLANRATFLRKIGTFDAQRIVSTQKRIEGDMGTMKETESWWAAVACVVVFLCLVVGASVVKSSSAGGGFLLFIAAVIAAGIGYWKWNLPKRVKKHGDSLAMNVVPYYGPSSGI
jgi:hypothetical protein